MMECPRAWPSRPARSNRSVVQPRWTVGALAHAHGGACGHCMTDVWHQRGVSGVSAAQSTKGIVRSSALSWPDGSYHGIDPRLTEGEERSGPSALTSVTCADPHGRMQRGGIGGTGKR